MHIYIMYEVPRNMVNQKNLGACVWIFYISIFKVVNKIIFYQSDLNPSNLLMVGDQGMKRKILISHHLISSWLIHTFSSLFSSPSLLSFPLFPYLSHLLSCWLSQSPLIFHLLAPSNYYILFYSFICLSSSFLGFSISWFITLSPSMDLKLSHFNIYIIYYLFLFLCCC